MSKKDSIEKYHLFENNPTERQFEFYDLASYYEKNKSHAVKPHTHSFYQIIFFLNPAGQHYIDFNAFPIKEKSLFFIGKNQVHYFQQQNDYKGYLLHFNDSFLLDSDVDTNFLLTFGLFNNQKEPYLQLGGDVENKIFGLLNIIEHEAENRHEFGNTALLSTLLKSLLLIAVREKNRETDKPRINRNNTYLNFLSLLEQNFFKKWSVEDFAGELSISVKTLNAVVKKETDLTVSAIIRNRIILEAKRKLTHSNIQVNEIAFGLGFDDPYYFTKFFKKYVNCTPGEFRKSIS